VRGIGQPLRQRSTSAAKNQARLERFLDLLRKAGLMSRQLIGSTHAGCHSAVAVHTACLEDASLRSG